MSRIFTDHVQQALRFARDAHMHRARELSIAAKRQGMAWYASYVATAAEQVALARFTNAMLVRYRKRVQS